MAVVAASNAAIPIDSRPRGGVEARKLQEEGTASQRGGCTWGEAARKQAELQAQIAQATELEQGGRTREAFRQYLAALESLPQGAPADADSRLREKIIAIASRLNPPPAVPEEAQRFLIRGSTLLKDASADQDYDRVVDEFQKALKAAPWWGDVYFNLALVQEKAGDPAAAIPNLKRYLLATPNAPDAAEVKNKIIALEVLAEELAPIKRLEGEWMGGASAFRLTSRGKNVAMIWTEVPPGSAALGWKVGDVRWTGTFEGQVIRGKAGFFHTDPREVHCFREKQDLPIVGTVAPDGNTITLTVTGGIVNLDTCTVLSNTEGTEVYTRR